MRDSAAAIHNPLIDSIDHFVLAVGRVIAWANVLLIGVIILLITFLHTTPVRIDAGKVELAGLYWHFVDLVWVFIFGCFYLL